MTGDRGSASALVAVAVVALLLMAGLVVDGGGKVRAMQRADRLAGEAGRAAGQQVDLAEAIAGRRPRVATAAAIEAARRYLRRAGVEGVVEVSEDRREVSIDVTTSVPTVFLGLVGVHALEGRGNAVVELVPGVEEERP